MRFFLTVVQALGWVLLVFRDIPNRKHQREFFVLARSCFMGPSFSRVCEFLVFLYVPYLLPPVLVFFAHISRIAAVWIRKSRGICQE